MVFTGLPCSFSLLCLISVFHGSIRCFFNKKNSLDLLWTRCVLGKPCGSPAAALSLLPALRPPHSVCFQVLLEIAAGQYNFYFISKFYFENFFFCCSVPAASCPLRFLKDHYPQFQPHLSHSTGPVATDWAWKRVAAWAACSPPLLLTSPITVLYSWGFEDGIPGKKM